METGERDESAVGRFLAVAACTPARLAVDGPAGPVTYGELAGRTRVLAGAIRAHAAGARVLIVLPPGPDAYAAMLATLMAGGTYAPVSATAPPPKQHSVARRFDPDVVLAPPPVAACLAAVVPRALAIDPAAPANTAAALAAPAATGTDAPAAYVIFTSGSTGVPKGVSIERAALDRFAGLLGPTFDIRAGDRVSQWANVAFDASVVEIFGALCNGASLHPPIGGGERIFPAGLVRRAGLTHWVSVPSAVSLMRQARQLTPEAVGTVRHFIFGGEKLTLALAAAVLAAVPAGTVHNTYGPTEATVCVSTFAVRREDLASLTEPTVPIGAPLPGMRLHLAGGGHENEGELVITGPQLARGYLGDAEATARAFRMLDGERAYHTGDWVRRSPDGALHFAGRIDRQLKHKGFRVEAGEIEAALAASGAPDSVIFSNNNKLVAMVELDDAAVLPDRLRAVLRRLLDPHAVPDEIVVLPRLPRNDNGKVDRAATEALYVALEPAAARLPERAHAS